MYTKIQQHRAISGFSPVRSLQIRRTREKTLHIGLEVQLHMSRESLLNFGAKIGGGYPDMEFVQNFTPPDFQPKKFTPSITPNFNSFSKIKHKT